MSIHHELWSHPENVTWGRLSAALPPVLTVAPGDTLTVHTLSGAEDDQPPFDSGLRPMPEHARVFAEVPRGPGPHIMIGPIAIEGATPGDVATIEILDMRLRADWGFTRISPGRGALPQTFPDASRMLITIDRDRRTVRLPWGTELPARPFFGIVGTCPPPQMGDVSSVVPGRYGGNMDVTLLQPEAILSLPVFVDGGLVMIGDGHAVQGNGEVCVTAVEAALTGTVRFGLLKGQALDWPFIETPEQIIALGFHEDLNEAALIALRALIRLICERTPLSLSEAYMLCSIGADLSISQMVNVAKGVHATIEKAYLHG